MPHRPKDEAELQKREAIGVIRASRFVRKHAKSNKRIDVEVVKSIHKEIFSTAWPDIAGKYREESVEISDSSHRPPHFSAVSILMNNFDEEIRSRIKKCEIAQGYILDFTNDSEGKIEHVLEVVMFSARMHHMLTFIHPFREGNGRTARLAGNLILERYGLVGLSVKIERSNKDKYRKCLAQADKDDYEPLIELITDGLIERYNGVPQKPYTPKLLD